MGYVVSTTPAARRMIRKLPPKVREHLKKKSKILADNALFGKPLTGGLSRYRAVRTVYRGTHYRIAYVVDQMTKQIVIVVVGPRQDVYKKLSRIKFKM